MQRSSLRSKRFSPTLDASCPGGICTRNTSPHNVWLCKWIGPIPGELACYRKCKLHWKGLHTNALRQHRGNSLERAWAKCEDLLTNFRVCVRRARISKNFFQKQNWWVLVFHPPLQPVLTITIFLASSTCPAPLFPHKPSCSTCPSQQAFLHSESYPGVKGNQPHLPACLQESCLGLIAGHTKG